MKHSLMTSTNPQRDFIETFGGYNHHIRIPDSDFYDMRNMSSRAYPCIASREKRISVKLKNIQGNLNGFHIFQDLPYGATATLIVAGNKVYFDGSEISGLTVEDSVKTIVRIGTCAIIMPDKKYVDFTGDYGNIEGYFSSSSAQQISYTICDANGTNYPADIPIDDTSPTNPEDGDYWIDTSGETNVLKKYSSSTAMWVSIQTTYIKIKCPNISREFDKYDGVYIEGTPYEDINGKTSIIWDWQYDSDNHNNDYIVVVCPPYDSQTSTNTITIKRRMPDVDFLFECNNRLWGCRYGMQIVGNEEEEALVNEIYASKQGDFKNWNCFMGISSDSYVASVGTNEPFTGVISFNGSPLFFKQNYLHKIYGQIPSNFQIDTLNIEGINEQSEKSVCNIGNMVLYHAKNGVYSYDGSYPYKISNQIDFSKYHRAVSGYYDKKYFISVEKKLDSDDDSLDKYDLFVYDIEKQLWHKEDHLRPSAFVYWTDGLYAVCQEPNSLVNVVSNKCNFEDYVYGMFESEEENKVDWSLETGEIGVSLIDNKYISRMNVRMSMEIGSTVSFFIQYDSNGDWQHVHSMTGKNLRSFTLPIRPKRCDHFRLRIIGIGDAKIYSISKTLEQGSDI